MWFSFPPQVHLHVPLKFLGLLNPLAVRGLVSPLALFWGLDKPLVVWQLVLPCWAPSMRGLHSCGLPSGLAVCTGRGSSGSI